MSWTSAIRRLPRSPARRRSTCCARVLQRLLEAIAAERLQQVVDGVHFERLERVFVVRGHEHHRRHALGADLRITPKPSHAGICTSRNTRSGEMLLDGRDRLLAVGALADDLDVLLLRAAARQSARAPSARRPRPSFESCSRHTLDVFRGLVQHSRASSDRNGIVTITASPRPPAAGTQTVQRAIQMLEPRPGVRKADA